jgi:Domain of unknown function (DUF222)/HNH endonuclease
MERVREFQQTIRIAYAGLLDTVADMDRSDTAKHAGYTRLSGLLVELLNVAPGKAARMVRQAEQITENVTPTGHVMPAALPTVRAAVQAGLVDGEHIDVIAEKLAELPATTSVEDRELVEVTLAETAQVANPLVVRDHGRILVEHLHADGTEPRHEDRLAEPKNSLSYRRTRDGGMDFKGHVERECAEMLENLIHAFSTPTAEDTRPRAQRLGDALSDVIDAASNAAKLPTTGGERPHLAVYLNWDVLTDAVGTATLESGTPLSASATRRLACDAEIIPIVLGGDSVPLDLGRAVRLVKPAQRKALIARDKGCAHPNCSAPASWCDAHHIIHWLHGGPTDLNNLVLLCRKHHRILHHSHWHVSINPSTGLPEFRPPKWIDPEQKPLRNTLRH